MVRGDPAQIPELGRLESLLDGFGRLRLLVAGDLLLDETIAGEVERISPEAPVPVVWVRSERQALGGAGNVLANVLALGAEAHFCAWIGDDAAGERALELLREAGADTAGVVAVAGRPTVRKTRVVARGQQIVRIDRESDSELPQRAADELAGRIEQALAGCHGVALGDYGKGALGPALARRVLARCRERAVPVVLDPKDSLEGFGGVELIKPNLREAERLSGQRIRGEADLARAAQSLSENCGGAAVAITCGGEGLALLAAAGAALRRVPAAVREVYDVQGAGDTSLAALALALRAGATLLEAAVIANAAAGVAIGKTGTAAVRCEELRSALPAALAALEEVA